MMSQPQVYKFGTLATEKKWRTLLNLLSPSAIVFWCLRHYLRIIVCQHGVYMEMKMAESN